VPWGFGMTEGQNHSHETPSTFAALSDESTEIYLQAVESGEIPQSLGTGGDSSPGSPPSPAIRHLLDLGLLKPGLDGPVYVPVDPATAAEQQERKAAQQVAEAATLRDRWSGLTTAYRSSRSWNDPGAIVRYVQGKEAISQQLALVVSGVLKSVRTIQPGGPRPREVLESVLADDLSLLRRGIHRQILYQDPAKQHAPTAQFVRAVTEAGAEVRTLPYLPDRLFLIDDLAVYPIDGDSAVAAFNAEPSTVAFFKRLFAQHWDRAAPFEAARPTSRGMTLTPDQRRITRLVCEQGLTSEAVAATLGWSLRTVNRNLQAAREVYDSAPSSAALAWRVRGEYPEGLPADW
jgi:sugar-specific transcriptional regulator TrmB/DNA-binding CsgD family transcriptional regulator